MPVRIKARHFKAFFTRSGNNRFPIHPSDGLQTAWKQEENRPEQG
ncbi:hypothetical protein [Dyadobacter sediminis]|nr:hypothetical protein [Dyadobacter sediminis]